MCGLAFLKKSAIISVTFCGHAGKHIPPCKTNQTGYMLDGGMSHGHFWLYRLTVRTPGFHSGNRGSIPRRVTSTEKGASSEAPFLFVTLSKQTALLASGNRKPQACFSSLLELKTAEAGSRVLRFL